MRGVAEGTVLFGSIARVSLAFLRRQARPALTCRASQIRAFIKHTPQERDAVVVDNRPPKHWPQHGAPPTSSECGAEKFFRARGLQGRCHELQAHAAGAVITPGRRTGDELSVIAQPALHRVSFELRPGEKIGVVGRTGSGKTSCIMALFRQARGGRIALKAAGADEVSRAV